MVVATKSWFSTKNCISLLHKEKKTGMKTNQEYDKQRVCKQEVDEPIAGYGSI